MKAKLASKIQNKNNVSYLKRNLIERSVKIFLRKRLAFAIKKAFIYYYMKKALIFDFDGTIADSWEVIFLSMEAAFKKLGLIAPTQEELVSHFGAQEHGILRMISPEHADELFAEYLKETVRLVEKHGMPAYDGLKKILDEAKKRGMKLAVISGKSKESLEITLEATGLKDYFSSLKTGGETCSIKPKCMREVLDEFGISAEDAYYIGDAVQDILDSRKVGVEPIAAAWAGTANPEKLAQYSPVALFTNVDDLYKFLFV